MCVEVNLTETSQREKTAWEDIELCPKEASKYRAAAARLNYLALDRPDILFASKECSRRMSAPRNGDSEEGRALLGWQAKIAVEVRLAGAAQVYELL